MKDRHRSKSLNGWLATSLASAFVILMTGGVTAAAVRAAVPEYSSFEIQARSNVSDGFNLPAGSSFSSGSPAISNQAVITFRLIVVGSTGNAGLWFGSGGVGSVVYDAPVNRLLGDPAINSAGVASFERSLDFTSEGVYLYDPQSGNTTLAVPVGGPLGIDNFADPQINDSGEIGCRVDLGAVQAYIVDDAGTQTQYAVEGSDGVGFLFVSRFNSAAQLAGKVRLGGTAESQPDEIRRYEPAGGFTTIAVDQDSDGGSLFTRFSNGVGISDNGWTAFTATTVDGDGVYVSDGVTTRTIATEAHPEISGIDFFRPVVNEDGIVAFRAFDQAGLRAIFVGDGTTLRRVVTEHDILPTDLGDARVDQHDTSPVFGGNPAINADGDVAFAATLTPPDDNQVEWGTGVFVAYAGEASAIAEWDSAPKEVGWTAEPNPFHDSIRLVADPSPDDGASTAIVVSIAVYHPSGCLVRTLSAHGGSAGTPVLRWDGRDEAGRDVPAGIYYVKPGRESQSGPSLKIVRIR